METAKRYILPYEQCFTTSTSRVWHCKTWLRFEQEPFHQNSPFEGPNRSKTRSLLRLQAWPPGCSEPSPAPRSPRREPSSGPRAAAAPRQTARVPVARRDALQSSHQCGAAPSWPPRCTAASFATSRIVSALSIGIKSSVLVPHTSQPSKSKSFYFVVFIITLHPFTLLLVVVSLHTVLPHTLSLFQGCGLLNTETLSTLSTCF